MKSLDEELREQLIKQAPSELHGVLLGCHFAALISSKDKETVITKND